MEWFNANDASFFGVIWSVGFASSLFVTLDSNTIKSVNKCFVLGGLSGFFALAVVGIWLGRSNEPISGHWYYICVAAGIGLCSRLQIAFLKYLELNQKVLFGVLLKKVGLSIDEDKKTTKD